MDIFYGKRFSKDIDAILHETKVKQQLLEVIEKINEADTLAGMMGVRKIEGYQDYFRIKIGNYRLGIKLTKNRIELIRFLHRKEIYRRFP